MQAMIRAAVAAALLAPILAGCMPTRSGVEDMVARQRAAAYTRWNTDVGGQPPSRGPRATVESRLPRLTGELGLHEAVILGLQHNMALRRTLEERRVADGRLVEAYSEALPKLDVTASHTRYGSDMQTFTGDRDASSIAIDLVQPLYKGGSIGAALRGARYFEVLSDEIVRQQAMDTVRQVAQAYYDVLLARELVMVQEEAIRFARRNRDDVKVKLEKDVAIKFDLLRAEVEVSNVEADLIARQSQLDVARTALFRAMGVSQKSEVTMATSDALKFIPVASAYEDAVRTAFESRPALLIGELDVQLQEEFLRTLRSRYYPELEVFARQFWSKPGFLSSGWDDDWAAGLRLRWSLFDGLRREGQIMQQKAIVRQSVINLADTEQGVLADLTDVLLELKNAETLVESQALNLERALEAMRLVDIGLAEGVNTQLELLDARAAWTRAAGLHYEALHRHATARLAFERVLGVLEADTLAPNADEGAGEPAENENEQEQDATPAAPMPEE